MDKQPLVSVIMNCYNSETYLKEAIDSVYAQTYTNWEIIFWDNASTDNSADIAQSYDEKLRYFRGETNVPLGEARNLAINQAKGEYIAFLDCDDVWTSNKLELQVNEILNAPDSVLNFGITEELYADGSTKIWQPKMVSKLSNHILGKKYLYQSLLRIGCFLAMSCVLMRKDAYWAVNGINSKYRYVEDYDLWLKLSAKSDFSYIPQTLAYWRRHEKQCTTVISDVAYKEHIQIFVDCLTNRYAQTDVVTAAILLKKISTLTIRQIIGLKR